MEHFGNRSTQAQQHVYTTTPYNLYSNQPPYIAGYQAVQQHHPMTFQQGPSHSSRPPICAGQITNNVQHRQGGHEIGGNGVSHGNAIHQASVPSGSVTHSQMHQSGTVSADGPHSVAQGIAPLATSLTPHYCMLSSQDMPLRIVVDARYVGAIIGQGGSSIREITKESKARCVVDVEKAVRDLTKNTEKVISILGQPEGCSKACIKILEVVRREMEKDNTITQHPDIELKIRAHNQLVGRLIGKGGATIKKIMEETGAHIYVSNEPTLTRDACVLIPPYASSSLYGSDISVHLERTVTVKASTLNTVSAAEQKISQKLRSCFEADMNNRVIFSSSGAAATMPLITSLGETSFLNVTAGVPPAHYARSTVGTTASSVSHQQVRTVHMWVPNNMVGALIGAKGAHIRSAVRLTGAQLRIEGGGTNKDKKESSCERNNQKIDKDNNASVDLMRKAVEANERVNEPSKGIRDTNEKQNGKNEEDVEKTTSSKLTKGKDLHAEERLVTITGNDAQQYKAQLWIYQRIAEQSCHYIDEVRLCTEIPVPSRLVGRIIGKGGQNVRELQRSTGAQVKIPDDAGDDERQKATTLRVLGNFQSSQAVQVRLGQLISDFSQRLNIGPTIGQSASNTQGIYRSST